MRIIQKCIVYAIGLSPPISTEENLRRPAFFGQYGKVVSLTVSKPFYSENQGACHSAYITYSTPQEASVAILCVDQFTYDQRQIRCSFGRTKYCKYYLRGQQCLNKECPY